jgi:hypothetical protein
MSKHKSEDHKYQQLNIILITMLVMMMYVKFLIVQNNLYIDGLKDMKSQKK